MSNAENFGVTHKHIKFYATLPHKIDESVEEYLTAIEDALEAEWEFNGSKLDGETHLGVLRMGDQK